MRTTQAVSQVKSERVASIKEGVAAVRGVAQAGRKCKAQAS